MEGEGKEESAKDLRVFVKTLEGKTNPVQVVLKDTVQSFKQKIAETMELDMTPECIILFKGNQPLKSVTQTLAALKIEEDSEFRMLILQKPLKIESEEESHWHGQYNDQQVKWMDAPEALKGSPKSITAKVTWRDQGWGNRKGVLVLRLIDSDGKTVETLNLFGIAEHHSTSPEKAFTVEDCPLLQKAKKGHRIEVHRYVGGGGGHQLYVSDFSVIISYSGVSPKEEEDINPD
mmetsp:Transcript_3739/g.5099  ORF Transcript_3739/g.5099 Transcript_3739/m.5099 type:complete len:233 (-) Transcript_3739:1327-2025(-)